MIIGTHSTLPPYKVAETFDVVYGTADGYWQEAPKDGHAVLKLLSLKRSDKQPLDLTMDIFTPEGLAAPKPLFFTMHGGAFYMGSKSELAHREFCRYFASRGYVAVSVNYRMGFKGLGNDYLRAEDDALDDAVSALHYLSCRQDLGIDPDRVFLAGSSAGAATMLRVAYQKENPIPFRLRAVAVMWGYVRDLGYLACNQVPLLTFQSERDPLVPYGIGYPAKVLRGSNKMYGTLAISRHARELGIPVEHHPYPERRHALYLTDRGDLSPRYFEIREAMEHFFDHNISLINTTL